MIYSNAVVGKSDFYQILDGFADELIAGGIQKKKPSAIPNVRNQGGQKTKDHRKAKPLNTNRK